MFSVKVGDGRRRFGGDLTWRMAAGRNCGERDRYCKTNTREREGREEEERGLRGEGWTLYLAVLWSFLGFLFSVYDMIGYSPAQPHTKHSVKQSSFLPPSLLAHSLSYSTLVVRSSGVVTQSGCVRGGDTKPSESFPGSCNKMVVIFFFIFCFLFHNVFHLTGQNRT